MDKSLKNNAKERQRRIESRIPKSGFLDVCITGACTALIGAMAFASRETVQLLLENGGNPYATEVGGNNPLMIACVFNRVDNLRFWFKEFPDWNLEARTAVVGGTALSIAVYFGPKRLKLTKYLLDRGANMNVLSHSGSSVLLAACDNEDADPDVIRLILDCAENQLSFVNFKRNAQTLKWKIINLIANISFRFISQSKGVLKYLAEDAGETALHEAVRRGDMEIVELLLSEGADPSFKNDLGQDAAAMCTSFPELRGVLKKRERKMKLHGVTKSMQVVEVLGKRISTATPIQHEMWLISLETLLMLYVCYSLCPVDLSLSLSLGSIYLTPHTNITHTGMETEAKGALWRFIRS